MSNPTKPAGSDDQKGAKDSLVGGFLLLISLCVIGAIWFLGGQDWIFDNLLLVGGIFTGIALAFESTRKVLFGLLRGLPWAIIGAPAGFFIIVFLNATVFKSQQLVPLYGAIVGAIMCVVGSYLRGK